LKEDIMSTRKPPVPPANRSYEGTGDDKRDEHVPRAGSGADARNFAEQDRQGNIRQNTRNQGYQQDR
jgi:hypothetical protein